MKKTRLIVIILIVLALAVGGSVAYYVAPTKSANNGISIAIDSDHSVKVSSFEELALYSQDSTYNNASEAAEDRIILKLTADSKLTSDLKITKDVHLDLNGHQLDLNGYELSIQHVLP